MERPQAGSFESPLSLRWDFGSDCWDALCGPALPHAKGRTGRPGRSVCPRFSGGHFSRGADHREWPDSHRSHVLIGGKSGATKGRHGVRVVAAPHRSVKVDSRVVRM